MATNCGSCSIVSTLLWRAVSTDALKKNRQLFMSSSCSNSYNTCFISGAGRCNLWKESIRSCQHRTSSLQVNADSCVFLNIIRPWRRSTQKIKFSYSMVILCYSHWCIIRLKWKHVGANISFFPCISRPPQYYNNDSYTKTSRGSQYPDLLSL